MGVLYHENNLYPKDLRCAKGIEENALLNNDEATLRWLSLICCKRALYIAEQGGASDKEISDHKELVRTREEKVLANEASGITVI